MKSVIIVAGGSGKRMGSETPKQFLNLIGKPILMHTIETFFLWDNTIEIILVLPEAHIELWHSLCEKYHFNISHKIAQGGTERFYSVKNGLALVSPETTVVAIHDGVRPFADKPLLNRCFTSAESNGNAIPAIAPTDSLRHLEGDISHAVDRSLYRAVQTPQCFDYKTIIDAYNQPYSATFTDDASVVESTGKTIFLVEGAADNIKITNPIDLAIAEIIITHK